MCADRISLTLLCLRFVRLCLSASTCVCGRNTRGTCVIQMTPCLCGFVPGAADAWIMWCGALGAMSALGRPGIISQCGPQFALSEGTESPPRGGRPPCLRCGGGVRETNPPAGGIRCYLSEREQHHQSLLSASLCPESNQRGVIHLRR